MKNPLTVIRNKWNRYLARMAEVNRKLYGDRRLDCCDLDRDSGSGRKGSASGSAGAK